jgi:hypothetical protein
MAKKNQPAPRDIQGDLNADLIKADLRTDYALIATGFGAALLAFAYLLLT